MDHNIVLQWFGIPNVQSSALAKLLAINSVIIHSSYNKSITFCIQSVWAFTMAQCNLWLANVMRIQISHSHLTSMYYKDVCSSDSWHFKTPPLVSLQNDMMVCHYPDLGSDTPSVLQWGPARVNSDKWHGQKGSNSA